MRIEMIAAAALAASIGVACSGTQAPATSMSKEDSRTFIAKAIEGNLSEVMLGHLAQTKAQRDDVRQFGQMLVTDHSNANQQAINAAQALNVTPPSQPTPEEQQTYHRLASESGPSFDRDFIQTMIKDHRKDINEYHKETTSGDPAGNYARASLPTLQKHLHVAQELAGHSRKIYELHSAR